MNKGYWVVAYRKVFDQATVKNYAALLVPVLEKFGARMLVSPTSAITAKEAAFEQLTIVVEFDSSAMRSSIASVIERTAVTDGGEWGGRPVHGRVATTSVDVYRDGSATLPG